MEEAIEFCFNGGDHHFAEGFVLRVEEVIRGGKTENSGGLDVCC